ncbi:MAG: hypothetical protein WAX66_04345 [Patescibacteria group bacterium]
MCLGMIMRQDEPGVWVDGDIVCIKEAKSASAKRYKPVKLEDQERVFEILKKIQHLNTMSSWTAQTERESDDLHKELRSLATRVER